MGEILYLNCLFISVFAFAHENSDDEHGLVSVNQCTILSQVKNFNLSAFEFQNVCINFFDQNLNYRTRTCKPFGFAINTVIVYSVGLGAPFMLYICRLVYSVDLIVWHKQTLKVTVPVFYWTCFWDVDGLSHLSGPQHPWYWLIYNPKFFYVRLWFGYKQNLSSIYSQLHYLFWC